MITRLLLSFFIIWTISPIALGQPSGDPRAIDLIRQAEQRMGSARALVVEATGNIRDTRPGYAPETSFSAKAQLMKPNFARIDYQSTATPGNPAPKTDHSLLASDGKKIWNLVPEKNRYTKRDVRSDGSSISFPSVVHVHLFFQGRVPHSDSPAIYIGTETWNGKACEVVEFREADPNDAAHPSVRQRLYFSGGDLVRYVNEQLGGKHTEEYIVQRLALDPPLSPADFAYAPPSTAIDATPAPPAMMANGTVAPDFTVQDKDGRPIKLSDFRGKIVVLDFWSTSCGPCLESREHLNSVAKLFGDDVVLFAVHVWDPKSAFDAWLTKHPELDRLRFAIDPAPLGKDVATTLYKAPGLPTLYLIGRDGRILNSHLGFAGPTNELELEIKKAGGTAAAKSNQ